MHNPLFATLIELVENTKAQMPTALTALAVLWGCHLGNLLLGNGLLMFGIHPRRWYGLPGIGLSPLLHVNFNHIFFNSIPFFVLSVFILLQGGNVYCNVTVYLTLLSGGLTWLIGRNAIHVGASGLITGYWSLLMMAVTHSDTPVISIILGFICLYYFAGIFFGILPTQEGVSWEGHLCGFLSGIALFYLVPDYLPLLPWDAWLS